MAERYVRPRTAALAGSHHHRRAAAAPRRLRHGLLAAAAQEADPGRRADLGHLRENVALREAVEQAGDFSILDNDGLTLIKFRDTGTYLRALSVKLDPHE